MCCKFSKMKHQISFFEQATLQNDQYDTVLLR